MQVLKDLSLRPEKPKIEAKSQDRAAGVPEVLGRAASPFSAVRGMENAASSQRSSG